MGNHQYFYPLARLQKSLHLCGRVYMLFPHVHLFVRPTLALSALSFLKLFFLGEGDAFTDAKFGHAWVKRSE